MNPKVDSNLLDPATPSGRDDWWMVFGGIVIWEIKLRNLPQAVVMMGLECYVVARAEAGCADCISAILECPDDGALEDEMERVKKCDPK